MGRSLLASLILLNTAAVVSSWEAGNCGPASVSTIPGCWGVPGCAYVIASDGGACSYDYCNCGGTNVPLLPQTILGTTTVGCASYTVQPTANNCPTKPAVGPGHSPPTPSLKTATKGTTESTTTSSIEATTRTTTKGGSKISSGQPTKTISKVTSKKSTAKPTDEQSTRSANDKPSHVQTLTKSDGSSVTLTLPAGSTITGLTTVTRQGTKLTIRPDQTSGGSSKKSSTSLGVIIGGSTIAIPSSSKKTITKSNGSSVIIGPSGIVVGSKTIPIPNGPTTITKDGQTLTFGNAKRPDKTSGKTKSSTSKKYTTSTAKKSTDTEKAVTKATATSAITPPPAGSPGSIPTGVPAKGKKERQIAVTFAGETYLLPNTVSVKLLQPDGSFVTLLSDSVVSGTATVSIPSSNGHMSLASAGFTVEAGPTSTSLPGDGGGGGSGFSGLIDVLEDLAETANSIVNKLDKIGALGVSWAAGSLSESSFSTSAGSLFDSVTFDLSGSVSHMSATIDSYNPEIYEMTEDGLRRIFPARTAAVEEFDLIKSLDKLVRGVTGLRNDVLVSLKNYWKPGTAAAAAIVGAEEALRNFGKYNWAGEKRKTSTTSTKTSTTMDERSRTSTSSKNEPTPKVEEYMFTTKTGTELSTFKEYIKTLPDKGKGYQIVYDKVPFQSYVTKLTEEEAKDVDKQSFVNYIGLVTEGDNDAFGTIARPQSLRPHNLEKRMDSNINLQRRRDSDEHLKVLSVANQQQLEGPLPNYLFDPALGRGQTIYVLDGGCNIDHEDFQGGDRTVRTYVVPNDLTLRTEAARNLWAPEDITDYRGHGTMVASVAAGRIHGVASNADLVIVKMRNYARNPRQPDEYLQRGVTLPALQDAWDFVINDVLTKRGNGYTGKSIINMSFGWEIDTTQRLGDARSEQLKQLLESCWIHDIITVIAAGNGANRDDSLDEATPQNHGTTNNGLITVGAVTKEGVLMPITTFDKGEGGSMTVYAVGEEVVAATHQNNDDTQSGTGTSFAAPAIAGLAAYFASLPSLSGRWTTRSVSTQMKEYIVNHAYVRSNNPVPSLHSNYPPPAPESMIVGYNRAPDGLCAARTPDKRAVSGNQRNETLHKRDSYSKDVDVVISGTIVVSSLAQSYCEATSKTTKTISKTTVPTKASTTTTSVGTVKPTLSCDLITLPYLDIPTSFTLDHGRHAAGDFEVNCGGAKLEQGKKEGCITYYNPCSGLYSDAVSVVVSVEQIEWEPDSGSVTPGEKEMRQALGTVLNGCNTNTVTAKTGGSNIISIDSGLRRYNVSASHGGQYPDLEGFHVFKVTTSKDIGVTTADCEGWHRDE